MYCVSQVVKTPTIILNNPVLVNCNWVSTRWQQCSTHLHTNSTQNDTNDRKYVEQHKNFGRMPAVPRLCELYPGMCLTTEGKITENPQSG